MITIKKLYDAISSSENKYKPIHLTLVDQHNNKYVLIPYNISNVGTFIKADFEIRPYRSPRNRVNYTRNKLYDTFIKDRYEDDKIWLTYMGIIDLNFKTTVEDEEVVQIIFSINNVLY